jgi:hypothetical protein
MVLDSGHNLHGMPASQNSPFQLAVSPEYAEDKWLWRAAVLNLHISLIQVYVFGMQEMEGRIKWGGAGHKSFRRYLC